MRRSFADKSAAVTSITSLSPQDKREWFRTQPDGVGLPAVPGVYRFRVPMEHSPDEKIEFLAQLRWRRWGMKILLLPTFEYPVDDEFITIPEGTEWSQPQPGDPEVLSDDAFPIVQRIDHIITACPFCRKKPSLAGSKIDLHNGDAYTTTKPFRFNQFWFTCCEWIAPAPRSTISQLIRDWNDR